MTEKGKNTANRYAPRRVILFQDTLLSVVATLVAVLLVRWLSEPIPGFTAVVLRFLAASLVLSVVSFLVVGSIRQVIRYATARATMRLLWAMLLKEAGLALCILLGWTALPSPVFVVMALLADFVISMLLLLGARFMAIELNRENAKVAENAGKGTVLVSVQNLLGQKKKQKSCLITYTVSFYHILVSKNPLSHMMLKKKLPLHKARDS